MTQAFPLAWPEGWPRTAAHLREDAKYKFRRQGRADVFWTFAAARDALLDEVRKLGATSGRIVLSSNFPTGRDGYALDPKRRPDDQGVAVYFDLAGKALVMAQDRYTRAEENMRSVALAVEAMRQLDRHGGGVMMERAFAGFAALPPPRAERPWHVVLGVLPSASIEEIRAAYREMAHRFHPDVGGTAAQMAEINAARARGLAERTIR